MNRLKYNKVLAHRVIHNGRVYKLSIVEIDDDGKVAIEPFSAECHSTPMVNGTVAVLRAGASAPDDYPTANDPVALYSLSDTSLK